MQLEGTSVERQQKLPEDLVIPTEGKTYLEKGVCRGQWIGKELHLVEDGVK